MRLAVLVAVVALVLVLCFSKAMFLGLNHDENQFIAPAVLLARPGLLPYRDYPSFHVPNLTFVYALLAQCFSAPFLAARIFCTLCATATVGLVFWEADKKLAHLGRGLALGLSGALVLLMICSPVFSKTIGLTWNHDLPLLLTLLGFFCQLKVARGEGSAPALLLASGLCVGFAAGARLSFAPLLAPFFIGPLLMTARPIRERFGLTACVAGGAFAGLLPTLYFAFADTEQFLFGNFVYPKFSRLWRNLTFPADESQIAYNASGYTVEVRNARTSMDAALKFRYFFKNFALNNMPVVLAFLLVGVPGIVAGLWSSRGRKFEILFFAIVLPFVLWGCIAPTRFHRQYYYALMPFLILGSAYGLSCFNENVRLSRMGAGLVFASALAAIVLGAAEYRDSVVALVRNSRPWQPMVVHREGKRLRELCGEGKVLTISPVPVLEGGLEVYPEFATGAFAWRSSQLTSPEKRLRLHIIAPGDLERRLAADPARAIFLLNSDPDLEKPLLEYAQRHDYRSVKFGAGKSLWLAADVGPK
ncbi:MAG: hypothetical protein QOD99_2245 [Chthoniobacter sp.]|jgi:hypothetical protein|nr:hypothetical protein [Chthoniobacter sp.]